MLIDLLFFRSRLSSKFVTI